MFFHSTIITWKGSPPPRSSKNTPWNRINNSKVNWLPLPAPGKLAALRESDGNLKCCECYQVSLNHLLVLEYEKPVGTSHFFGGQHCPFIETLTNECIPCILYTDVYCTFFPLWMPHQPLYSPLLAHLAGIIQASTLAVWVPIPIESHPWRRRWPMIPVSQRGEGGRRMSILAVSSKSAL